jgi:hypothetical protein
MYSINNPELHPPRLCKKTGLMHNARPDEHTPTSRPNAQTVKKDVPQTHANAGTRPRARNQAENHLVSFVDSPPRPPSTRRLGGDLFSLPATQITSAANQTRNLASFALQCGTLESRHERLADADVPRRLARMADGRQVLYTSITPAGKILLLALPNPFETATSNNPTCIC